MRESFKKWKAFRGICWYLEPKQACKRFRFQWTGVAQHEKLPHLNMHRSKIEEQLKMDNGKLEASSAF